MTAVKALFDSYITFLRQDSANWGRPESMAELEAYQRKAEVAWATRPVPGLEGQTPVQFLTTLETPDDWQTFLIEWSGQPASQPFPELIDRAIADRLDQLGPVLINILSDRRLQDEKSPGRGFAPAYCAKTVGWLRYEPATSILVKMLEETDEFTLLGDAAIKVLTEIGEPAKEPLCAVAERHKADPDGIPFTRAVEVLTSLPRDERTWPYLKHGLTHADKMIGFYIALASDYGDQRAVFHLNSLLEERELDPRDQDEALEGIRRLGGIPTARARSAMTPAPDPSPFARSIGRNDPCPCGSGKKYKRCCLNK